MRAKLLAQTAFDAVAHDAVAHLAADGKAYLHFGCADIQHHNLAKGAGLASVINVLKLLVFAQPVVALHSIRSLPAQNGDAQRARPVGSGSAAQILFSFREITPSGPCGRADGGGPARCDRPWSSCGHGSRAPCYADASWADTF